VRVPFPPRLTDAATTPGSRDSAPSIAPEHMTQVIPLRLLPSRRSRRLPSLTAPSKSATSPSYRHILLMPFLYQDDLPLGHRQSARRLLTALEHMAQVMPDLYPVLVVCVSNAFRSSVTITYKYRCSVAFCPRKHVLTMCHHYI
jgi:hypothetical protein